jgi:tetratricopeptide (TPR) repeat protein
MPRQWLRLLDPTIHQLRQEAASAASTASALAYGRALNGRSLHEEAQVVLDRAIAQDRGDGDLWFERVMAQGDHGTPEDLEALVSELAILQAEHPEDGAVPRNMGFARILQQRGDEAEQFLRKALEADPADAKTLELLGLLCIQRDDPQEGKTWLLKALSLQPRDPRSLRLLGITYMDLGDVKAAETQFMAALEQDPEYFWGWHSLGELLLKRDELEEGLRCIHRARAIQPREPASYFILAEIFSEQGHLELSQAELHQLTAMHASPETLAEAYAMIGEIRRDQGDLEGATSYFSLAAETDPVSAEPWAALGDVARTEGRWDEALQCYQEALTRRPEAADIQVQAGYAHLHLNHPQEGERLFRSALEQDPGEYSAYLGLSECYRHLQRPEEQLEMVRKALELAPEDPDAWNAHGVALELTGRAVEATEAYERALALAPMHRKAANNLGFLLEKRMQAGEADLRPRATEAWKRRLLICRDEGQSLKMATEHLGKLGVGEDLIRRWLEHDATLGS